MEKFNASFDSLRKFKCPEWYKDAKLGIWSVYGPQSVPMCGDWYARNMYIEDSFQYLHHLNTYGHPSKHGYIDICKEFKAENFDADSLMEVYKKAGAKFFVAMAMHHDNYFLFPSKYNKYNSVEMAPKKDIIGMWKEAAKKYDLPFGITEHHSASFSWNYPSKLSDTKGPYKGVPYDGSKKELEDFYYDNREHIKKYEDTGNPWRISQWYTENKEFHKKWLNIMNELIDKYEPDLFYSDGPLPFGQRDKDKDTQCDDELYKNGLEMVSHLYNKSIEKYGENRCVYNQKDKRKEVYDIGVLDIERSQLKDINEDVWQTDTCIGSWFYDAFAKYKSPEHVIEMFVDIVSKNGILLLNIPLRPDGTLDDNEKYILEELGEWTSICGEGIYGSRPYRVWCEGETRTLVEGMKEEKAKWSSSDYRFTKKDNIVYAFQLGEAINQSAIIKSFNNGEKIKSVRLLGFGECEYVHKFGVLTIKLPKVMPTVYVNCYAIEME